MDVKRLLYAVKVDDDFIILGKPIEVEFYGKKFTIKQINWYYKWEEFSKHLGAFLQIYSYMGEAMTLPDSLEDFESFRKNIRLSLGSMHTAKDAMMHILKMAGLMGIKARFIKKNFTLDDYIELFLYIYLFNVIGVKKKPILAFRLIRKASKV